MYCLLCSVAKILTGPRFPELRQVSGGVDVELPLDEAHLSHDAAAILP